LHTIANANQTLSTQLQSQIDSSIAEIKQNIPEVTGSELLPSSSSNFRQFELYRSAPHSSFNTFQTTRLQQQLTIALHTNKFNAMLVDAKAKFSSSRNRLNVIGRNGSQLRSKRADTTSARLLAVSAKGSGNWLKAIPNLPSHVLTDTHYQLAMRL